MSEMLLFEKVEDVVNHPKHYETGNFECIDVMVEVFGFEAVKNFCLCNAFKYLYRCKNKGKMSEDMEKANWYLNKHKELETDNLEAVSVKTNADVIRSMNDEELDEFLAKFELGDVDYAITFCDLCAKEKNIGGKGNALGLDCDGCRGHWLSSGADDWNGLHRSNNRSEAVKSSVDVVDVCLRILYDSIVSAEMDESDFALVDYKLAKEKMMEFKETL